MSRGERIGLFFAAIGGGFTLGSTALGLSDIRVSGVVLWLMGGFGVLLMLGGAAGVIMSWHERVPREGDAGMASQEVGDPAEFDALRGKLAELRNLDVRVEPDLATGLPPMGEDDPLYTVALETWNLLRAERLREAADAFYGEFGPSRDAGLNFARAFHAEVGATSREAYRDRRVRLLEGIVGRDE